MSKNSDPAIQRRALDAFDAVSALPVDQREIWLNQKYPDDPALRVTVLRLLAAARRASVLPTEPPEVASLIDDQPMHARIGPYRPTAVIGEGGMGRVYRAERADGHFEQVVAIKVVAARLFAGSAAEQFLIERQILAKLHHPHIAQLFDGGMTDDGQPYLVMELIDGVPITTHANEKSLDMNSRLRLFIAACDAVQYAHQQLVVHADIKPTNILIDTRGVKLVDFGIGALLSDQVEPSDVRPRGKTPAWASPQLAGGARPTPPDDIYALGLLLDALVPDGQATADLSAISACAASLNVADRYPSADAIAADVARYIACRPVKARSASVSHSALLFWRRNRLATLASATFVLGLITALVVSFGLYLSAEAARQQAQRRFEEVRSLSHFMLEDVTDALEQSPGTSRLRRALAVRGRVYLEQLSRIPGAPLDLRLETARGYEKTGEILARNSDANIGDPLAGRAALRRAESELATLLEIAPRREDVRVDLARTLVVEATVMATSFNETKRALVVLDRADRLLTGLSPGSALASEAGWVRWDGRNVRATILNQEGRFAEMVSILDTALAEGSRLAVPRNHASDRPIYEAASLRLLGDARFYLGRPDLALGIYKRAVAVIERARVGSTNARLFDRSAYYHFEVASTLSYLNRPAEALPWIDKGASIIAALATFDDSPRTQHVANIVKLERAETLGALHRYGEAVPAMQENIADRRRLAAAYPYNYEERRAVPVALRPMVVLYFAAGRVAEGCRTLSEARAMWRDLAAAGGLAEYDQSQEMADLADLARRCPASTANRR